MGSPLPTFQCSHGIKVWSAYLIARNRGHIPHHLFDPHICSVLLFLFDFACVHPSPWATRNYLVSHIGILPAWLKWSLSWEVLSHPNQKQVLPPALQELLVHASIVALTIHWRLLQWDYNPCKGRDRVCVGLLTLHPQGLVPCPARETCSLSICWMNTYVN